MADSFCDYAVETDVTQIPVKYLLLIAALTDLTVIVISIQS